MPKKIEYTRTQTSFRFPDELLKTVKVRCAYEDEKMNDYVIKLVESDISKWKEKNPNR